VVFDGRLVVFDGPSVGLYRPLVVYDGALVGFDW